MLPPPDSHPAFPVMCWRKNSFPESDRSVGSCGIEIAIAVHGPLDMRVEDGIFFAVDGSS